MRHQYGIFALVTQTSFCDGLSGDLAKRRLFSQALGVAVVLPIDTEILKYTTKLDQKILNSKKAEVV